MERVRRIVSWQDISVKNEIAVAVLDTGLARHPDLSDRVIGFQDFVYGRSTIYDDNGHGTHVCGILCGNGGASKGKYCGIAPGVKLLVGKVLDENGDGKTEDMLEGLDWLLSVCQEYQIRIVNISVGIGGLSDVKKERALKERLERLWDSGIVVVCAAGNKGPKNNSISSVGNSNRVITVGCFDGPYEKGFVRPCSVYSGRGRAGGVIRKPDVVAPGTEIMSCNGNFYKVNGEIRNPYAKKSGTSMATPIVSGALALLLGKNPELTNEECKQKLQLTASDLGLPWNQQGWGMVNISRLIRN